MNGWTALAWISTVGAFVFLWLQDRAELFAAIEARNDIIESLEDEIEDMRDLSDREATYPWN